MTELAWFLFLSYFVAFQGLVAAKQNDSWALAGPGEEQQQQGQSRSFFLLKPRLRIPTCFVQNPADDRRGGEDWAVRAEGAEYAPAGI